MIPKLDWNALEWLITLRYKFATIQIPEVQLDEFSKNMAFFQEMLQKSQFEEEKQEFPFKMVHQYAQEAVHFLAESCSY